MIDTTEIVIGNGDKVSIRVRFNDLQKRLVIDAVSIIPKGKRTQQYLDYSDDYDFRKLKTFEEREAFKIGKLLEVLEREHLNQALMNTWESIKPMNV